MGTQRHILVCFPPFDATDATDATDAVDAAASTVKLR